MALQYNKEPDVSPHLSVNQTEVGVNAFADNRPEAVAQKKMKDYIRSSPVMAAQREVIQRIRQGTVQRQGLGPEEEELTQPKFKDTAQRVSDLEEEELKQPKFKDTAQRSESHMEAATHTNNTGLPDSLKSGIETLSGISLDDVKVHYGSDKPAQLNAHAYAQGTDIHVASGQEHHLPHEAWHVVQQKEGRVKPTMQLQDVAINDDSTLENEADVMGNKALRG